MTKILTSFFFVFLFILPAHADSVCDEHQARFCAADGSETIPDCQICYEIGAAQRPGSTDAVVAAVNNPPPPTRARRERREPRTFTMTVDSAPAPQQVRAQAPVQQQAAPVPAMPMQAVAGKYATQFATPIDDPMAVMPNWNTVAANDVCYINPTFQTNNDALMTIKNETGRMGRLFVNGAPVQVVRMAITPSGMIDGMGNAVPTQGWAVQSAVSQSDRGNQRVSVLGAGEICYMTAPLTLGGEWLEVTFVSQMVRGWGGTFAPSQAGELLYTVPVFEAEREMDRLRPMAGRVERFVFTANELR